MPRRGPIGRPIGGLILALLVGACSGGAAPSSVGSRVTIFAAASLRHAITAAIDAYRTVEPDVGVTLSTDSTATLRTQIEQGAPADLFLAADTANAQRLADAGLTDGPVVTFAGNSLALVVPSGDPAGIRSPTGLVRPGVHIVAAGEQVPITAYAERVVAGLAALPGYPANFAARYAANIVSREDNVTAVLTKIELGEGDAGLVYRTDALGSADVDVIDLPPEANVVAGYAGVVVRGSVGAVAARAFLDWLLGSDGQALLARFGFVAAPR